MSDPQSSKPIFDPLAAWKPFQDAWAKTMGEAVASEDFAKSLGAYMDAYLQSSAPVRQQMEKAFEQFLRQMNMPPRSEITALAERLTNLEMRVDDLDAKLDETLDHLEAIRANLEARPKTRRK